MLLKKLLQEAAIKVEIVSTKCNDQSSLPEIEITTLSDDTRLITPNSLFVVTPEALPHIHSLLSRTKPGAILFGKQHRNRPEVKTLMHQSLLLLFCDELLQSQGKLSSTLFHHPSRKLRVVGVTGTNGKTSIAWFLYQLWKEMGIAAGMIGTLGVSWHSRGQEFHEQTGYTTPRIWKLQEILAKMVKHKVQRVALEASSEGLALGRLHSVQFHTAVFSGLGRDHLDYHKNIENYFQAKKLLFTATQEQKGRLIISMRDSFGKRLAKEMADHSPLIRVTKPIHFDSCKLPLFHQWNMALAWEAARFSDQEKQNTKEVLKNLSLPRGRFEVIGEVSHNSVYGIVDYAHTSDALDNLLSATRKEVNFLVCIFGCGGNRDSTKRPLMGKIACRWSDRIIVCDDNPRSEDPKTIRQDILMGIPKAKKNIVEEIPNRKDAIHHGVTLALDSSRRPAVVVVAGKGHEEYQILADKKILFCDKTILADTLL